VMRFIVSLVAVLTALGVGAFAFLSAERTIAVPAVAIASPQVAPESQNVAAASRHTPVSQLAQVGAAETPGASGAPARVEQESEAAAPAGTNSSAPNTSAQNVPAPAASTIPQCDKPGGMGLARIVEMLIGVMLFATSHASPAAFNPPLVHKDTPPAHSVPNVTPIRSSNPATEIDLFRRFVDWLKRQPH
jgi:hypothetical protein